MNVARGYPVQLSPCEQKSFLLSFQSLAGDAGASILMNTLVQVFEDNLAVWMDGYHQLLTLPEPIKALFAQADDDKLSTMHQMQRSVCEAILLYADKVCSIHAKPLLYQTITYELSLRNIPRLKFVFLGVLAVHCDSRRQQSVQPIR